MKRVAMTLFAVILMLGMVGCGKNPEPSPDTSQSTTEYEAQATESGTQPSADESGTDPTGNEGTGAVNNDTKKTTTKKAATTTSGKAPSISTAPTLEIPKDINVEVPKIDQTGKTVSVMTWAVATDPSCIQMKSLYKKLYGGTVDWNTVSWGDYASTLQQRSMAGTPPDVFTMRQEDSLLMVYKGMGQELDGLFDLSSALWKDIKARNDGYKYGGKLYSIISTAYVGRYLWYNKNIIMNAGQTDPAVLYKQGKWDWDAMISLAKATTKDTKKTGSIDQYGFSTIHPSHVAATMLSSYGVDVVKRLSNGKYQLNLDDANVNNAYNLLYDLYNTHGVCAPAGQDNLNLFAQGKAAMYLDGSWIGQTDPIKTLHKNKTVGFVPVPKVKGASSDIHWASLDYYMIPKGKNVNTQGAVAFINMRRYMAVDKDQRAEEQKDFKSIGYTDDELQYMQDVLKSAMPLDYIAVGSELPNEVYLASIEVSGYGEAGSGTPWATVKELHRGASQQSVDELNNYVK